MCRITRLCSRLRSALSILVICVAAFSARSANAQITNTLFFEDFESPINPLELVPDAPFFEGGQGDIAGTVNGGVLEFTGTVSKPMARRWGRANSSYACRTRCSRNLETGGGRRTTNRSSGKVQRAPTARAVRINSRFSNSTPLR